MVRIPTQHRGRRIRRTVERLQSRHQGALVGRGHRCHDARSYSRQHSAHLRSANVVPAHNTRRGGYTLRSVQEVDMSSFVGEARASANGLLPRISAIAAIGGLLFGYDTGVISGSLRLREAGDRRGAAPRRHVRCVDLRLARRPLEPEVDQGHVRRRLHGCSPRHGVSCPTRCTSRRSPHRASAARSPCWASMSC